MHFLHPQNRYISCIIGLGIIIGYIVFYKYSSSYYVPRANNSWIKKIIRSIVVYSIYISSIILPLDPSIILKNQTLNIVIDNSLSMYSEDQNPLRINIAKKAIASISTDNANIHCFSESRLILGACKKQTIISNSGSSITDLLALAGSSNSGTYTIVFSDGGVNTGIDFSSLFANIDISRIIWFDIYPYTGNIIISGQIVGVHQYQKAPLGDNYFIINNNNSIDIVTMNVNTILTNYKEISTYLRFGIICMLLFIIFASIKKT